MATAFKYNVGKKIELPDGSKGIVITSKKHSYDVKVDDKIVTVWGFDIINNNSNTLKVKGD